MTDLEKLLAQTNKVLCVEEITTKRTYYNCFGDKIDEDTHTISTFYTFKRDTESIEDIWWIKGQESKTKNEVIDTIDENEENK